MDTSVAGLLSGMIRSVRKSIDPKLLVQAVNDEFADNGPNNPLSNLNLNDKATLIAIVTLYEHYQDQSTLIFEMTERLGRLADDAGRLAKRMDDDADALADFLREMQLEEFCEDLRLRLVEFSAVTGMLLSSAGKPGHKQKTLSNSLLVAASEFLRLKVGSYSDEHLAEFMQARSDLPINKELSGDAIRKKRRHLSKQYPRLADAATEIAKGLNSHSG